MSKTLQQLVRDQVGAEGPQLPGEEYEARIDKQLGEMTAGDLLGLISDKLEGWLKEQLYELGVKVKV